MWSHSLSQPPFSLKIRQLLKSLLNRRLHMLSLTAYKVRRIGRLGTGTASIMSEPEWHPPFRYRATSQKISILRGLGRNSELTRPIWPSENHGLDLTRLRCPSRGQAPSRASHPRREIKTRTGFESRHRARLRRKAGESSRGREGFGSPCHHLREQQREWKGEG